MDPLDHPRLRGLVAPAFTPRRIEDLRTTTVAIARELTEDMARHPGPVDLVQACAYPLPVRVIRALLGVPPHDEAMFTAWSRGIARSVDPSVLRLGAALARMEAQIALSALLGRFDRIEKAGAPTRRPTFTLRGLETLPVML